MDSPLPATTSGHRVSLGDRLRATNLVARLLFVSLKIGPSSFRGLSAGHPDLADILHAVVRDILHASVRRFPSCCESRTHSDTRTVPPSAETASIGARISCGRIGSPQKAHEECEPFPVCFLAERTLPLMSSFTQSSESPSAGRNKSRRRDKMTTGQWRGPNR